MDALDALVAIATDLTAALSAEERYRRLLQALKRVIPYDAAALLRIEGHELVPIASEGLSPDAMGRRFSLKEHPRLDIICRSDGPVSFPSDTALPDPYDGLLAKEFGHLDRVHSCFGCPLRLGDTLIGALTADALTPHVFDDIDVHFLSAVGALAAAEMHTTHLIAALEQSATRHGLIARDMMRAVQLRQGADMIGTSNAMQRLRQDIELVARSDFTVLITGETGVGKDLVARAIHAASARHHEPMLYVNCAALPEALAESELFGHVRGAFTGATGDRPGKFEVADNGTVFLDEIGELPLVVQPKLLRAIQNGEIQRVGSDHVLHVDVRIIAATNRDLEREVAEGKFRADLFHRLNVYPLYVPPLRERTEDIPLLAGYFCDMARRRIGIGPVRIHPDAIAALQRYLWPGNVRELENVLSRATLKAAAGVPRGEPVVITRPLLGRDFEGAEAPGAAGAAGNPAEAPIEVGPMNEAVEAFKRTLIAKALAAHGGNWAQAARALGMHRSNLHHMARRLGIK